MALIVETGVGLANAESYTSVEDAEAFLVAYGFTRWATAPLANREAALRRGTRYIELMYATRWPGQRTHGADQALSWPRQNVIHTEGYLLDDDVIPIELKSATIEAAKRELLIPQGLFVDEDPLIEKRVQVGPLSVEYFDQKPKSRIVPVINGWMTGIVLAGSNSVKFLKRA